MRLEIDETQFKPVHIVLESRDEVMDMREMARVFFRLAPCGYHNTNVLKQCTQLIRLMQEAALQ